METVTITKIRQIISASYSADDAQTLRTLGRDVLYGKAALYAYALQVYKHGDTTDWYQWVKHSLQDVCSAKDIHMIAYSASVLARLDDDHIVLIGDKRITSWYFITKRLTYLQDALPVLRKLDYSKQDDRLFEQVIEAAATMSRADLRAYIDMLNFGKDERAVCQRKAKAGTVTFTIVCDEQQAAKLEARLKNLVALR